MRVASTPNLRWRGGGKGRPSNLSELRMSVERKVPTVSAPEMLRAGVAPDYEGETSPLRNLVPQQPRKFLHFLCEAFALVAVDPNIDKHHVIAPEIVEESYICVINDCKAATAPTRL